MNGEGFGTETKVVTTLKRLCVRFDDLWLLSELLLQSVQRWLRIAFVQPVHKTKGEEVLTAVFVFHGRQCVANSVPSQSRHRDLEDAIAGHRLAVFKRVRFVLRLLQIAIVERIFVDDERTTAFEVLEIRLQGRRVHRDKSIDFVARRENFFT